MTDTSIPHKTCTKCKELKPLDDFHRQRKGPMGRHCRCKTCTLKKWVPAPGLEGEQWKPVEGYPYEVSDLARVRNNHTGQILAGTIGNHGYRVVFLTSDTAKKLLPVHRIVALAFCPGYEPGLVVNHIDANKLNNLPCNLEWCTVAENAKHAAAKGLYSSGDGHYARTNPERLRRGDSHYSRTQPERLARGARHGSQTHPETRANSSRSYKSTTPLTGPIVLEMRRLYATGQYQQKEIAEMFNVSRASVNAVVHRETWTHLPGGGERPKRTQR